MKSEVFFRCVCFYLMVFLIQSVSAENLGDMLSGYVPGTSNGTDQAWSVWVGGNLEKTGIGGKLQGRAFVRGNFTAGSALNNGYEIGNVTNVSNVFPDPSMPTLVVGGDILGAGEIKVVGDLSIQVGSNIASTVVFDNLGTVITGDVDYAAADALRADLSAKSRYWGSLPDTPGGSISTTSGWSVQFKGIWSNSEPMMYVFNLTNDLTKPPVLSNFLPGDSILINCKKPGTDATFVMQTTSYESFGGDHMPKVLWNFPDATEVTIGGSGSPKGGILLGNPNSVTTVSMTGVHQGRFVSCGSVIHTGGGSFYNYPFTGDLSDIPPIYGYLFIDKNNDQIRNSGDTTITNATVSLIVGGEISATTNTNSEGYYSFTDVPAGVVTVQVVQASAPLVAVPESTDPMRNRAVANATDTSVIEYTVVSGQTSEPLNFGYETHPLSTRIDLKIYADNNGAVKMRIATVNENGNNDIEIYAMIDGGWTLVAMVPSELIEGMGSNSYTVEAFGLTPGASYMFKIIDESGHIFYTGTPIEVARSQLRALATSLTPEYFIMKFNTEPYAKYVLKMSTSLAADAEWKSEFVKIVHPVFLSGVSEDVISIQGAPEGITTLRVPRNRDKAFFKLIQVQ